jgi:hypothetical protein
VLTGIVLEAVASAVPTCTVTSDFLPLAMCSSDGSSLCFVTNNPRKHILEERLVIGYSDTIRHCIMQFSVSPL